MSEVRERYTVKWTSALTAAALMALAVIALHLPRAFLSLPLYSSDEGSYLLRALYGDMLQADPQHAPFVANVDNVVFFWIIRLFGLLPGLFGLDALRIGGGLAYVLGLVLVWRVVAPRLNRGEALGLILLALIYPYYRFVFTALPEGWYVALLGGMILLTARLWRPRPLLHAAAFGAMAAALVLIKPHGLAVMCAGPALVVADLILQRGRGPALAVLRLVIMAAAFLATGHLLRVIESHELPRQLSFFGQGFYAQILDQPPAADATRIALTAHYAMTMTVLMLAGPAIALGLDDLLRRVRDKTFAPQGTDLAFLLTLGAFAATICMVSIFAFKMSFAVSETYRLWGRYFEFFIPLLWLTAWPAIRRREDLRDRRLLAAGTCLAGLVGLTIALREAITLFPWDVAALHAFSLPTARYAGSTFPSFALAVVAMLGAIVLMLRRAPMLQVWQGAFFILALLAIGQDGAWLSQLVPDRRGLAAEIQAIDKTTRQHPGRIIAFVEDANTHHNLFYGLHGRPRMVLVDPGASVQPKAAAGYGYIVLQAGHPLYGRGWRPVYQGLRFTVLEPTGPMAGP